MGKKYIVEVGRLERLYKASVNGNGKPNLTWLSPEVDLTPYTEPDLAQVRKEGYEEGKKQAKVQAELDVCHDIEKVAKENYKAGLSDAWEAVRKIVLGDINIIASVFGTASRSIIIRDLTPAEVIEKLKAYKQKRDAEIKVGDEVIRHYKSEFAEGDDAPSIFLSEEDGHFRCLAFNGRSIMIAEYPKNQYRKTGRHFPEIAAVLEKMRGDNND